jgi:hypothetical protein
MGQIEECFQIFSQDFGLHVRPGEASAAWLKASCERWLKRPPSLTRLEHRDSRPLFDLTLLDCFLERINILFGGSFQYLEKQFTESIFHFPDDCCFINRATKILMLIERHIP